MNLIQKENQQRGTTDWQLTNPADNRQIEGYASLTSVPGGGNISLFVNTADDKYSMTIYRMGWYQGTGGPQVWGPQTLYGVKQVIPTTDPATGLLECQWTHPVTIHVPTSWVSGIYLAKLHGKKSGKESYITFTVRDSRQADLVFQQAVITYQAYNPWPELDPLSGIGHSLYNFDSNGVQVARASFNRPYGRYPGDSFDTPPMFYNAKVSPLCGVGAGDFLRNVGPAAMDFDVVRWIEHQGYDVTYITDVDTHEDIGRVLRGKGFLSVGHGEYWSEQMRSNVVQARDQGVSLGFFAGNYIYWAVDLLPDSTLAPNRTIALVDPTKMCTFTCMGEPEQSVVGGTWVGSVPTNGDIVVTNDAPLDHWVFANTGLKVGDVIPGLIGIEYNGVDPGLQVPAGLQILLHTQAPRYDNTVAGGYSLPDGFQEKDIEYWYALAHQASLNMDPTFTTTCDTRPIPPLNIVPPAGWCRNPWPVFPGVQIDWAMTIYQASSGAWVFNAGTNQWGWGLDDYFTGLEAEHGKGSGGSKSDDDVNNGPKFRIQCGYPFFNPKRVSCRSSAIEQITRNVLNKFIGKS